MTLRRVSDQARAEGTRALQRALDSVRGQGFQRPVAARDRREIAPRSAEETAAPDEWTKALNRIADTMERVSAQLDSYQQDHAEQFDAIEFLLREMVIGGSLPAVARSSVRGGVIDPDAVDDIRA